MEVKTFLETHAVLWVWGMLLFGAFWFVTWRRLGAQKNELILKLAYATAEGNLMYLLMTGAEINQVLAAAKRYLECRETVRGFSSADLNSFDFEELFMKYYAYIFKKPKTVLSDIVIRSYQSGLKNNYGFSIERFLTQFLKEKYTPQEFGQLYFTMIVERFLLSDHKSIIDVQREMTEHIFGQYFSEVMFKAFFSEIDLLVPAVDNENPLVQKLIGKHFEILKKALLKQ